MPPEAIGLLLLAFAELAVVVAAIVDAARRPRPAWKRAGQSKVLWVALQPLGLFFIVGLIFPVLYFAFIRPSLRKAELAELAELADESLR